MLLLWQWRRRLLCVPCQGGRQRVHAAFFWRQGSRPPVGANPLRPVGTSQWRRIRGKVLSTQRCFLGISKPTLFETIPDWHFSRRLTRFGRCAVKGMLILAGAKPAR